MEWIGNILSGGVLGAVTSIFGAWFKYKQDKDEREFKLKYLNAESKNAIAEINAQIEVSRVVTEGSILIEEAKADTAEARGRNGLIERLTGNYMSESTLSQMLKDDSLTGKIFKPLIYLHVMFMDAVRGLIRPILTVGIVGYVAWIVNVALTPYILSGSQSELMSMVIAPSIQLILFSASTVIGFWFSSKALERRYQKDNTK